MIFPTYHANILWADIFVVSPTSTKHTSPTGCHVRGSISQLNTGLSYGITYALIALGVTKWGILLDMISSKLAVIGPEQGEY